jgi:septum formation protein
MHKPIILASSSPRRQDLLRQIGLTFKIDPADVDEAILPGEEPETYAVRVALDKARVSAGRSAEGIVVAADTSVVLDNAILGKPADSADAERMLARLSGRKHDVITGLALVDAGSRRAITSAAITSVWFRNIRQAEIKAYVSSGEPLDKAGGYGIQEKGALLVQKIDGCYFNVVGMPLSLLAQMLAEFGVSVL